MTHGTWLPLYDFGISALLPFTGLHNMEALKFVSLLFSLGTAAIVWLVARKHSVGAAWTAAALFAFTPSAILAGAMALPGAPPRVALVSACYPPFPSPLPGRGRAPP